MIRFGPAGSDEAFAQAGYKSSVDAPAWIAAMGLNAFEYQCGRGVRLKAETAAKIGEAAKQSGVQMSLHAPYLINLSSREEKRRLGNWEYVRQSCEIARAMGADRIVIHTGGLGKQSRETAFANSKENVRELLGLWEEHGMTDVTLCLETMGKINVIGTAEEIFELVAMDERLLPCIDFGHLNARTNGGLTTREEVAALFDLMENTIGTARSRIFHSHFSKIEYGKGGEVRHLTFADELYGPDFAPFAAEIAARGYEPRMICESAGTQARDAAAMKQLYEAQRGQS